MSHSTPLKAIVGMTPYAKRILAQTMYDRGRSFVGAAILLRQNSGYEFVVLHLLCQGIEVILKSFLLYKDYDKYSVIIKNRIGHDLKKAADAVVAEFKIKPLSPSLTDELAGLNKLYKQHFLRYASGYDHFLNPKNIPSDRVLRKLASTIAVVNRTLPWFRP